MDRTKSQSVQILELEEDVQPWEVGGLTANMQVWRLGWS
jgi:hypothetical protein